MPQVVQRLSSQIQKPHGRKRNTTGELPTDSNKNVAAGTLHDENIEGVRNGTPGCAQLDSATKQNNRPESKVAVLGIQQIPGAQVLNGGPPWPAAQQTSKDIQKNQTFISSSGSVISKRTKQQNSSVKPQKVARLSMNAPAGVGGLQMAEGAKRGSSNNLGPLNLQSQSQFADNITDSQHKLKLLFGRNQNSNQMAGINNVGILQQSGQLPKIKIAKAVDSNLLSSQSKPKQESSNQMQSISVDPNQQVPVQQLGK